MPILKSMPKIYLRTPSHNPKLTFAQSMSESDDDDRSITQLKQDIMIEHLAFQRTFFGPFFRLDEGNIVRDIGIIVDLDLALIMRSKPIAEDGFQIRGLDSHNGRILEESIRANGWISHAGHLAVCEIPWSQDEVKEVKDRGLTSQDWEPPPLLSLPMAAKPGSVFFDSSAARHRMQDRRFGLIDGNNRVRALNAILAERPTFLDNVCVNATLVNINPYNRLQVIAACLQMNTPYDRAHEHRDDEKDNGLRRRDTKRHRTLLPSK
jgi:hypothetical protein